MTTLKVQWTNQARRELGLALDYIRLRDPTAAERLRVQVEYSVERAAEHPFIHRPGRVPGTREAVVHPNYLYIYELKEDCLRVLRILHARQQYP